MKKSKSRLTDSPTHRLTESPNLFTLIEILMVCALLAFLMAIMVGAYSIASTKMAEADCIATMKLVGGCLEQYKEKTGYYIQAPKGSDFNIDKPQNVDDATHEIEVDFTDFIPDYRKLLSTSAEAHATIDEIYVLVDPYGTPYWYRCPGTHNRTSFDIESAGPDGEFGYSDKDHHLVIDDADETADNIKNWE